MVRSSLLLLMFVIAQSSYALDSDKEQPATLEADDFEMDFQTGVRVYRGDVVFRQGSIKLTCDELTTYMNPNDELDKAICVGSPGTFKQRPEGHELDVNGQAMEITMDEIEQMVTLKSRAKVVQGGTELAGRVITYDLARQKVRVIGSSTESGQTTGQSEQTTAGSSEDTSGSARPTIVIQPRKKNTSE